MIKYITKIREEADEFWRCYGRNEQSSHLAAHCLPLFFVHKPDATALVPPLVMPVYNIFFYECLPYSIDNVWLIFCAKLVSCGHAMT